MTATTPEKIARILYSFRRRVLAPLRTSFPISSTLLLEDVCFFTQK